MGIIEKFKIQDIKFKIRLLLSAFFATLQIFDCLTSECIGCKREVLLLDGMTLIAALEFYSFIFLFVTFTEDEISFSLEFCFVDFSDFEKSFENAIECRLIHFFCLDELHFEFREGEYFLLCEKCENVALVNSGHHKKRELPAYIMHFFANANFVN